MEEEYHPGAEPPPQCTENTCMSDSDENKFECASCKRHVHYRCTSLPLYQIQHFKTRSYRNYICINCTQVPEYLKNIVPNEILTSTLQTNEITELRTVLKQKEIKVEVLAETNRKLNKRITDQHLELEKKNTRDPKRQNQNTRNSKQKLRFWKPASRPTKERSLV